MTTPVSVSRYLGRLQPPKPDPRDPDYSREGVFQTHNCWRCRSGEKPCVRGNPHMCENLHARND